MKYKTNLPHFNSGFTLQELMISLAIFFIVTGLGIPSYVSYVRNGELSNSTTALFSDLHMARSEAIKRKSDISLCRSNDAMATNPTCGGAANDWTGGWIVYIETGKTPNSYDPADGDTILRVNAPPANKIVKIVANANANDFITFNPDGSLSLIDAPSVYTVCVDRDKDGDYEEATGREIRVNPMGRPKIKKGNIQSCEAPV